MNMEIPTISARYYLIVFSFSSPAFIFVSFILILPPYYCVFSEFLSFSPYACPIRVQGLPGPVFGPDRIQLSALFYRQ